MWPAIAAAVASAAANGYASYQGLKAARESLAKEQAQLDIENARYDREREEEKQSNVALNNAFSGETQNTFSSNFTRF